MFCIRCARAAAGNSACGIYKTLSHGKERDEEKRLAKPQTEPTFLCIFDTVQVTKVPTINVKNLMAPYCEREREFKYVRKCSTHMKWHEKILLPLKNTRFLLTLG